MKRGKFISLEGGEGVGKSTQVKALGAAFGERGIGCLVTREPGGSPGAEAIRALLLDGHHQWTTEAEALLFAAARADHVANTIAPALAAGRWVLSDRFLDSSLAYQGGAGRLGIERVRAINDFGYAGLLPDRTLVLVTEAGAERARMRDAGQEDPISRRDGDYHASVASAFRQLAEEEPERVRLIDASGSPEDVKARLLAELADLLP